MEIERSQLVEMFFERGDLDKAEQAESELPERFDPMEYQAALERLDINAGLLLTQSDNLSA